MEIKDMSSEELLERRSAIGTELDAPEADLDALEQEVRAINAELEARKNAEQKKAEVREAIAKGEQPVTKVKEFKEVTKMEERVFTPDTIEYRDAYMKDLMGKPMSIEERTALSSAASVIPTQTLNEIYGKLMENPLIGKLNALHIPGYVSIPKATTVNDASWIAISSASTDSADVVGSVALTAKKLIKTIEIEADIQAMSIPSFQNWLVGKLAQKMEAAICAAVLNGAGSSTEPQGITTAVSVDANVTTVTKASLAALMADVGGAYHNGAIWIMSSAMFFGNVLPLGNDVNGQFVQNGIQNRVFGHEVIIDDNAGSNIIYGNLEKGYVFNYGEGVSIEADQSVSFRSGSTVYRAMALCDGAVVDADAFAYGTIA